MVAGLIGTLVRQIPSFALHDSAAYARQMADLKAAYAPLRVAGVAVGPALVDVFERLSFFRVFSSVWFTFLLTLLVVSIVVCTLDRLPRLWRGLHEVRVWQPEAFFDPRLPQRATYRGLGLAPDELAALLRGRRFRVRRESGADNSGSGAVSHVYGDRNQYFKMATLLTHLGLILFLGGGAVTGALGYETVVFLGDGQTAPVQPVGTEHNLLVKNLGFEAPRHPDGSFADYRTDLAVYRDGAQIARQTIRVNEPLSTAGFVFHQNTFGPAADLEIRGPDGRLVWSGPLLLSESVEGRPQGSMNVPGSTIGLVAVLDRGSDGAGVLKLVGLAGDPAAGSTRPVFAAGVREGGATDPRTSGGYSIRWREATAFSGLVVKNDPGQGLIWLAYLCLISGLMLTFYFPRRRVWARFEGGKLHLAMLTDRYVDASGEFGRLLEEIGRRTRRQRGERAAPGRRSAA